MSSRSKRGSRAVARVSRDEQSSSSSMSEDVINRLAEAMTNALRTVSTPTPGPSRMIRGDVVPPFDPSDINQNITDWCRKIDEITIMFGWTEEVTIFNALSKLQGLASTWYKGLRTLNFTWEEWKEKLMRAFPSQRDYHELLEEMMKRKKKREETFSQYFYEKQALLNACNIGEREAVSCIIGGITDTNVRIGAKAANCSDPEALFEYLRNLNEEVQTTSVFRKHLGHSDRKRRLDGGRNGGNCYLCNKPGHIARNCTGRRIVSTEKEKERRCFLCQSVGHIASSCSKRRKTTEETR